MRERSSSDEGKVQAMRRGLKGVVAAYLLLAVVRVLAVPSPAVDPGRWHLLVIESDDWGLEAWFPTVEAANELADLVPSRPAWLKLYGRSSLESAAEVESLSVLLARHHDRDGLPAVVQANHIVAAVDLEGCDPQGRPFDALPFKLRRPGVCGAYERPGRVEAIDRARRMGVWRAELHGLTHFDLAALEDAWGDSVQVRAARVGTVAFPGWLTRGELGSGDRLWENELVFTAVQRFIERFGRPPRSVIAPDYTWNAMDEDAWRRSGVGVVQGKREQLDPAHPGRGVTGRVRKALRRWWDRRRGTMCYLERNARLEPYGSDDPQCPQGAVHALEEIRRAWSRGEAAILEMHRVQFSHFDPEVARAGRAQLDEVLTRLEKEDTVRYCVDIELAQLMRRGWSVLKRGPWLIVRNYTGHVVVIDLPGGGSRVVDTGTHILEAQGRRSEDFLSPQSYR